MANQIAKLFIRGKIANRTAKQLHPEELEEVGQVCQMVYNDPQLARAKTEFCAALGRTIRSEYKDQDFAQQEAWISFWLAAVDVLHHRPKKLLKRLIEATCRPCKTICLNKAGEPDAHVACRCGAKTKFEDRFEVTVDGKTEIWSIVDFKTDEAEKTYADLTGNPIPVRDRSIIENPIQRKKFFQTCLFNYLRQILRENARQTTKMDVSVTGPANEVAVKAITSLLKNSAQKQEYDTMAVEDGFIFSVDTWLMTLADIEQLFDLKVLMDQYNVDIISNESNITIHTRGSVPVVSLSIYEDTFVHNVSLDSFKDSDEQDSFRDHIESKSDNTQESQALTYKDVDLSDSALVVRERLCETGQKIFDLILDTPESYTQRFGGGKIRKAHVAKFLNLSPKEVNRQWTIIELQMLAVGLHP